MERQRSDSGNILFFTIIMSTTMALILTAVVSLLRSYSEEGFKTQDLVAKRLVLNGLMNYTLTALKQRWCFTSTIQSDPNCELTHPRNSERLFLRAEAIDVLSSLGVPLPDPVSLAEIQTSFNTSDITQAHPLYVMMDLLIQSQVQSVQLHIRRLENNIIASHGDETYLRVKIELTTADRTFSIESLAAYFPREVGSFALITNELHLDANQELPVSQTGHAKIPTIMNGQSAAGLTFESPVFVNKDIHLPAGTYTSAGGNLKSPVTFAVPVTQGFGKIYENGQPIIPTSQDSQFALFAKSELFGGFLGGIRTDGQLDRGVSVLAHDSSAASIDTSLAKLCIERNLLLSSLENSKTTELIIAQSSLSSPASTIQQTYAIALTGMNEFSPQLDPGITSSADSRWTSTTMTDPGAGQSVARFQIELANGLEVEFRAARGSQFLLVAAGDVDQEISNTTTELDQKRNELSALKDDNDDGKNDANIAAVEQQINQLEQTLQRLLRTQNAKPAIRIEIRDRIVSGESHPSYFNLYIRMENTENFEAPPQIRLEGFDTAYVNGVNQRIGPTLDPGYSTLGRISTERSGTRLRFVNLPAIQRWFSGNPSYYGRTVQNPPDVNQNLAVLCQSNEETPLPYASWDIDFSDKSFHSWGFTVSMDEQQDRIYDQNNSAGTDTVFNIHSIQRTCRIRPSAQTVVGFINCQRLIIEARTSPLRIIGTIIAPTLEIHRSALTSGIRWSSIYTPDAVRELRDLGILKPDPDVVAPYNTCTPLTSVPVWHPRPSPFALASRFACNASSLRAQADPFQWSTVDPDCALLSAANSYTSCKRQIKRYIVKEFGRSIQL